MKNRSVYQRSILDRTSRNKTYPVILLIVLLGMISTIPPGHGLAVAQQEITQQSTVALNGETPPIEVQGELFAEAPSPSGFSSTQSADFWRKKIKENLPSEDDAPGKISTLGLLMTVLDHSSAIDLALFDRVEEGIQRFQRMCPTLRSFLGRSDAHQVIQAAKAIPEAVIKESYPEKATLVPYYIDCISAWFLQAGGGGTHSVEAIPRLE